MKALTKTVITEFSDFIKAAVNSSLYFHHCKGIYFPATIFLISLPFCYTRVGGLTSITALIWLGLYTRSFLLLPLIMVLGWISPLSYIFFTIAFLLIAIRLNSSPGCNLLYLFLIFNILLWISLRFHHPHLTSPCGELLVVAYNFIFSWGWLSLINSENIRLKLPALFGMVVIVLLGLMIDKQMFLIGGALVMAGLIFPSGIFRKGRFLGLGIAAPIIGFYLIIDPMLVQLKPAGVYQFNTFNQDGQVKSDQEILTQITSFPQLLQWNGYPVREENPLNNLNDFRKIFVVGDIIWLSDSDVQNIKNWVKAGGTVIFITNPEIYNLIKFEQYFEIANLNILFPREFFPGLNYSEDWRENFKLIKDSPVWISSASSQSYCLIRGSPVNTEDRHKTDQNHQWLYPYQFSNSTWKTFSKILIFDYFQGQICIIAFPQMFQAGRLAENFSYISNQLSTRSRGDWGQEYLGAGMLFILVITAIITILRSRLIILWIVIWMMIWILFNPQLNFNFNPSPDLNLIDIADVDQRNLVLSELSRNGQLCSVQRSDLFFSDNLFTDESTVINNFDEFSGTIVFLNKFDIQSRDRLIKYISANH